jgi:CheY-like chemotaxis protein
VIKTSEEDANDNDGVRRRLTRARILIVEDDGALRFIFERSLATDHDVVAVARATDALGLVRRGERYDLILSDLLMPEMTGIALHAEIERRWPAQARRMVFLTGGATTDESAAFLQHHRWFRKPITPSRLHEAVTAWLSVELGS